MPSTIATPCMPMRGIDKQADRRPHLGVGYGRGDLVHESRRRPGRRRLPGRGGGGRRGGGHGRMERPGQLVAELVLGIVLVQGGAPELVGDEGEKQEAHRDEGQRHAFQHPDPPHGVPAYGLGVVRRSSVRKVTARPRKPFSPARDDAEGESDFPNRDDAGPPPKSLVSEASATGRPSVARSATASGPWQGQAHRRGKGTAAGRRRGKAASLPTAWY